MLNCWSVWLTCVLGWFQFVFLIQCTDEGQNKFHSKRSLSLWMQAKTNVAFMGEKKSDFNTWTDILIMDSLHYFKINSIFLFSSVLFFVQGVYKASVCVCVCTCACVCCHGREALDPPKLWITEVPHVNIAASHISSSNWIAAFRCLIYDSHLLGF